MSLESQQESVESIDEILRLVKSKGFIVSKRQLGRWQNQGLIPRPRQLHTKGILGSHSIYPAETGAQVCVLCMIAKHFRDQARIGWYLWRMGWSVDDKYWKPVFDETIKFLDDFLKANVELADSSKIPLDGGTKFELSDQLLDAVQKTSKQAISHPRAGPLKQRLGAEKFGSLTSRILDILVGNFSRDPPLERTASSDSDLSLSRILDSAFAQDAYHAELMTKVFEFLNAAVSTGTLVDQFRIVSTNQLQFVSGEIARFEGLDAAIMENRDAIPRINGIPVFSLKTGIHEQALAILGWRLARQMGENAKNLGKFYSKSET